MAERRFRAFVSSTFVDLKAHRAHVIRTLRESGLDVDPMEEWTSDSDEPRDFSTKRVEGCDLCILLVAFRRGYIPDGETRSITQQEYEHALNRGIDVLPFLLDDDTEWEACYDERATDAGISEWREGLRKRFGVKTFRATPRSLDVGPAVARWIQKKLAAAQPVLVPPFDFEPYLRAKREGFVGREWLFDEIEGWRTRRHERSLLIIGDPGIGKSAVVAELVSRNPGGQVLAYHCCRTDDPSTLQPGQFVRSVAWQIAQHVPAYAEQLAPGPVADALGEGNCATNPINAFEAGVLAPLQKVAAPQGGARYLLVDALDETLAAGAVQGPGLVTLLAARLEQLPPWLRLVATTRREAAVQARLRGLRAWTLDAQDPRNRDDVERYVLQRLGEEPLTGRLRDRVTLAEEMARVLAEKGEGNFLYVRQALDILAHEDDPLGCLRQLPPGLAGMYQRFFERHFPNDDSYKRSRRLAGGRGGAGAADGGTARRRHQTRPGSTA